jgi:PH (Pleckstrin Homology) domain-containing protein
MNPTDAQQRAQSELQPGENLYWTGTADPRRAAISALPATIFGIPFAGFALFWINSAMHATHGLTRNANAFAKSFGIFPLFGVPFLLVGLWMVLAPLWAFLKGSSTVYAVTDKRVMIITGSGNRTVKSCTPADIASVDYRERPDGSGDIVIGTNSQMRTNNSVSQVKVGLYGVANVKEVARQVLNLHTQQRPAA